MLLATGCPADLFVLECAVGSGFLLDTEQQIAALQLFYDFCDARGSVSSITTFMSDFCAPMLKAQLWCAMIMKKYTSVVNRLPAYDRCRSMLLSERGRSRIMRLVSTMNELTFIAMSQQRRSSVMLMGLPRTCMRLGVGLSGDPKIDGSGIPECASVLQGLKNLAAGRAVDEADKAVDAAKKSVAENKTVDDGAEDESGILADDVTIEAPQVEKDPVVEKAEELGLSVRSNIHVFHDTKTFSDGFVGLCRSTSRGGIYIDEATSKAKIILGDMMELWKVVTSVVEPQFVSIGIFCGKRHDLVTLVVNLGRHGVLYRFGTEFFIDLSVDLSLLCSAFASAQVQHGRSTIMGRVSNKSLGLKRVAGAYARYCSMVARTGTVDPPVKRLRGKTFLKGLDQSRSRWNHMSAVERRPFVDAAVKEKKKHDELKRELAHPPLDVDSPVDDPKPDSDQQPPVDENLVNESRFSFEGSTLFSRSTLGQGAHGTVYRCENLMGGQFAVKHLGY